MGWLVICIAQCGKDVTDGEIGEIKGLGAYSKFTLADENICFKPPSSITKAQAATVPLAAATAWLALFSRGCLNLDRSKQQSVLIWGGSCTFSSIPCTSYLSNVCRLISKCWAVRDTVSGAVFPASHHNLRPQERRPCQTSWSYCCVGLQISKHR